MNSQTPGSKQPRRLRLSSRIDALEARQLLSSTRYVDLNSPGPVHDGTSWDSAYVDLQQALADAQSGDELRVADGNYRPDLTDPDGSFQLKTDIALKGGYSGFGAADPDARDPQATPSVLIRTTGTFNTPVVDASYTSQATLFDGFTITSPGFGSASLRMSSGWLTINNCRFDDGGVGIFELNSAPTISNCLFTKLEGGGTAGGIDSNASSPTIINCQFVDNHGNTGGALRNQGNYHDLPITVIGSTFTRNMAAHEGQIIFNVGATANFTDYVFTNDPEGFDPDRPIYNSGGALTMNGCTFTGIRNDTIGGVITSESSRPLVLTDCTFTRNTANYIGAAVYTAGGGPVTITSCVFQGNTTYSRGGAIASDSSALRITNSAFSGNTVSDRGGGAIYIVSANATITNCTFSGNAGTGAFTMGGAILVENSTLNLRNSVLEGDTAAGATSEVEVVPTGTSTLSFDHCIIDRLKDFVRSPDPGADEQWGTTDDDYGDLRLHLGSSGIDGGDNFFVPAGITTDVAGNPRFVDVRDGGAIVDIGAYEYQLPLLATDGAYASNAPQPAVRITFNGDIKPSTLSAEDLVLLDPTTNQPLSGLPAPTVSYDSFTRTAIWTFSSPLPDGNYRAMLPAESVTDTDGNVLAEDFSFDFFVLAGDANHDAVVDTTDLGILAMNWNTTGKTFSEGDFNYDGRVDVADFKILATNWQKHPDGSLASSAPMPALIPIPEPAPPPSSSARRTRNNAMK
jgi:predicted outer membrane repeat protein